MKHVAADFILVGFVSLPNFIKDEHGQAVGRRPLGA